MRHSERSGKVALLAVSLAFVMVRAVSAQQLILKGEYGMMGGTLPPPGLYVGAWGGFSWADELRGPNGNKVPGQPQLDQQVFGPLAMWVSNLCILGGHYAAIVAPPFANVLTDFPRLDVSSSTGIALSQIWVIPVTIGWHFPQADLTFHYAFYAPTGRYTAGASNNTSLGMWANELSLRGTFFFDKAKDWHASLSAFYDINSKKKDLDWTTGNPVTLMYGLGRNYGSGMLMGWAGVAGYAQWQVTDTTGADAPLLARLNKTTIYGIGPELTTLQGAFTIRYFWQFGGKFSTQGPGLYVQFVMPLKI